MTHTLARHKVGETVYVFGGTYTRDYDNHPSGAGEIIAVNEQRKRELIPDYIIKIGKDSYLIPQVNIDETGYLKAIYAKPKRTRKTRK